MTMIERDVLHKFGLILRIMNEKNSRQCGKFLMTHILLCEKIIFITFYHYFTD